METVNDIIREMRGECDHSDMVCFGEGGEIYLDNLADRLDKAYKRDLQAMVDASEIDMRTAIREIERLRAALYCDGDYGRILKERDDENKRLNAALKPVLEVEWVEKRYNYCSGIVPTKDLVQVVREAQGIYNGGSK